MGETKCTLSGHSPALRSSLAWLAHVWRSYTVTSSAVERGDPMTHETCSLNLNTRRGASINFIENPYILDWSWQLGLVIQPWENGDRRIPGAH